MVQVVFAVIAPRQVVPNLVAGAIAEAGANQAGDMMQVCCLLPARCLHVSHLGEAEKRILLGHSDSHGQKHAINRLHEMQKQASQDLSRCHVV